MARDLSEAEKLITKGKTLIARVYISIERSHALCAVAQESIRTARELVADTKARRARFAERKFPSI
jgi:hypothetical protein